MKLNYFLLLLFVLTPVMHQNSNALIINEKTTSQPFWYFDYDITNYKIDITINDSSSSIAGNVTITSRVEASLLDTFRFELYSGMHLDSICINHQKISFSRTDDIVNAILPGSLHTGQFLSLTIYYEGNVSSNGFFSPVASEHDNFWNISVTWSLSEPLGAKYWLPCKQYLPDKIDSASINITVPNHCKAGSNGILTAVLPTGNNQTRYEWKTKHPIAYYLISFAVADYIDYNFYARLNDTDSVFVQNFVYNRPDYLARNKSLIDKTKDYLAFYSRIFGAYPFKDEKYGHCLAPMGGGMEHQTMTTLSSFDNSLVSHELAHQWFGDWVTCATWQDIWLNEGFASYCEYLVEDQFDSRENARSWMIDAHQNALLSPSGSVFVPMEESSDDSRIFSYSLTYKKGASILHMLRYELNNDSLFFSILVHYLQSFQNSVARVQDFISIVNQLSGKDYSWFFNQWYYGKGYPLFDITWKQDGNKITLISIQSTADTSTLFFQTHFDLRLSTSNGDTVIRLFQEMPSETFLIETKKTVNNIFFDPDEWLLKKAKIEKVSELKPFDNYLEVSPNPFSDELILNFKTMPMADRIIKLIDMKGDTVFEMNGLKTNTITLTLGNIPAGSYILAVFEGNKKATRRIFKSK